MAKIKIVNRYATIPNKLLNSTMISLKAKGMYAYIQSKPDDWEFSAERISRQLKEGLPSVISALKELETNGYLIRHRYQNNKGFWVVDYLLHENPIEENLHGGNPIEENPIIGKPSNISNQEFSKKDYNNYSINKERLVIQKSNFEFFWNSYGKKIDRVKCEKVWSTLTDEEIDKIMTTVIDYVKINYDIQFRKHPLTYLNGKCFNDDLIFVTPKTPYNNGPNTDKPRGTSIDRMEAIKNW
jgi:Uri superfamily endonuclease